MWPSVHTCVRSGVTGVRVVGVRYQLIMKTTSLHTGASARPAHYGSTGRQRQITLPSRSGRRCVGSPTMTSPPALPEVYLVSDRKWPLSLTRATTEHFSRAGPPGARSHPLEESAYYADQGSLGKGRIHLQYTDRLIPN